MKLSFFFISFFFLCLNSQAQLLLASEKWFGLKNYFNYQEIKDLNIEAIHIKIEDKKDGEIIRHKGNFLHYEFNSYGQLSESLKSIELANKKDTSTHSYFYDAKGLVYKTIEKYGPFSFQYFYSYNNSGLFKEIKIDASKSTKDTIHIRYFQNEVMDKTKLTYTLNSKKKAFKTLEMSYDSEGLLKTEKTSFSRGRNYLLKEFYYQNKKLSLVKTESYYVSKKQELMKVFYNLSLYKEINFFKEGNLSLKRVFTYRDDGLIKAVIERNYHDKSIRIYHFMYRFSEL